MSDEIVWSPEMDNYLGVMPDRKVAAILGISASTVAKRRREKSVAPSRHRSDVSWDRSKVEMLGKEPDSVIAKRIGCSISNVSRKRADLGIPSARKNGHSREKTTTSSLSEWDVIKNKPNQDFYKIIDAIWRKRTGYSLDYVMLSEITGWSHSRIQKWFAPKSNQKISTPIRHHLYLSAKHGIEPTPRA